MYLQSNGNSCIEEMYPKMAKISDEVIEMDNCVYDYGENLEHFVNVFKQTHDTTLTFESFVLQCYTKGYKMANFAIAFIILSAKNPKDKSKGETLRERKERL
ncbi:hypothetical protein OFO01_07455 [Campylobacter sp. JMF_01 NE2]|uniref:hypothetical protein n=1 Tax=unclassified Campylobacter TaxID=2593542 RepID=UPI0022E9B0CC|nr:MULTISPECIES: hypothetical protein [unclassified Campylobacter]MDA3053199.1 hypothetical protein [Campylobacter sp. JMF_03 NE3]MDA3067618.1 hypothetical protein [Campylobacter sp. JMF_01 NE2]